MIDSIALGVYDFKGYPLFSLIAGFLVGFLFVDWVFALSSTLFFVWVVWWVFR